MKAKSLWVVVCMFLLVVMSACSDRALVDNAQDSSFMPELASSATDAYYLAAVEWDGVTEPKSGVFYKTDKITALKNVFAEDVELSSWLNNLPQKTKEVAATAAVSVEPELLEVKVTSSPAKETDGTSLAALTWSAYANVSPSGGGATANCSTYTTNPAVAGFISHQIWVYNQVGKVYFAEFDSDDDGQEHAVSLTHSRSVACDSTVKCLGRVLLEGNTQAGDIDTYVRSCN